TKQGSFVSQPTWTIGLDPGDRNSWHCVLDQDGQIQLSNACVRVPTSAKACVKSSAPCRAAMATAATRQRKKLDQHKPRTRLTPTRLLMEGDYPQNPVVGAMAILQQLRRNYRFRIADHPGVIAKN